MSVSDSLHTLALGLGGACTKSFSQGSAFKVTGNTTIHSSTGHSWDDQGKMYKMVQRGSKGMGGVCATFCAFWIVFHAKQDDGSANSFTRGRSVWDYIFQGGALNMGAAMNIVVEHHMSSGNQLNYLGQLMGQFGLRKRLQTISGSPLGNNFIPLGNSTTFQCAKAITKVGGYKLIQLKKTPTGAGGGHMVSAWSDGQDVLFMDPNLGEFWLPSETAFKIWLASFFAKTYLRSGYCSMRVHTYA